MDLLPVIELSMKPTSLCDRDSQVHISMVPVFKLCHGVKACMSLCLGYSATL